MGSAIIFASLPLAAIILSLAGTYDLKVAFFLLFLIEHQKLAHPFFFHPSLSGLSTGIPITVCSELTPDWKPDYTRKNIVHVVQIIHEWRNLKNNNYGVILRPPRKIRIL